MPSTTTPSSGHGRRWRQALRNAVLVLGLGVSAVADACTLEALLRLPLERLLTLRVSPRLVSLDGDAGRRVVRAPAADRSPHGR